MSEPGRDERDASKEATDALKTLLARIGEIFGVFDLSFVVAGAVCLGALLFGASLVVGWDQLVQVAPLEWKAVHVAAVIVACYVLGMVCFTAGRKLRGRDNAGFYDALPDRLADFGLDGRYAHLLPDPLDRHRTRRYTLLYTLLWAEVRQDKRLAPSFNLLTRYWVLAAMCDGLAAAFLTWTIPWIGWGVSRLLPAAHAEPAVLWVVGLLGLLWAARLCSVEATRYARYQMYELCATLAYAHGAAAPPSKPPLEPA